MSERSDAERAFSRSPKYIAGYNCGYKDAKKATEIKVLEDLLNKYESIISDSKTLSTVIHERIKELKESK